MLEFLLMLLGLLSPNSDANTVTNTDNPVVITQATTNLGGTDGGPIGETSIPPKR
jgi:hypothetical protein